MDIRAVLTDALAGACAEVGIDVEAEAIGLERPANPDHGDWSSNVALASAKKAGRNPRELAAEVVAHLESHTPDHVAGIEIAGPGFVNFRLHDTWLHAVLAEVVAQGTDGYAAPALGEGTTVDVEFVSANPNKPIHAGHGRGACFGDSLARVYERCGYAVTREFYLNDRGVQMANFAASLAARKAGEEPPEDGYHGAYVAEWAAEMPDDADPLEWGYARALESHRATLATLDITFDVWFSERSMVADGAIEATLGDLRSHGVVYEADDAVWLRSTDYGDDKDRVLVKSDGQYTYLLPDIAYHRDKFSRASRLINVWGADHHGYVPRMKAAMVALGHDPDELDIVITQLVDLVRAGEAVQMSGRTGDLIELDDLVAEVGADAVRFTYLMQSVDTRQTFDIEEVARKAMDNPVFYVQYAHARICSIGAKVAAAGFGPGDGSADHALLVHPRELEILRVLYELPDAVALACRENAPHKVLTWVRELAAAFHGFYHDCYVVGDDVPAELTRARLDLVEATRVGLVVALGLLGVSAPEAM